MNREDVVYIYNGILFSYNEERYHAICDMYGSWGHYTEINKMQENIQYDMTHTQNPKKAKHIETVAVTKGTWGDAVKGYRREIEEK